MRSALVAVMLITGCGSNNKCTPGMSAACTCTDGANGAQFCKADGTFNDCECLRPADFAMPPGSDLATTSTGDMATTSTGGAKRVFVTKTLYAPTALATVCRDSAQAAGLGTNFKPWLSSRWSTGNDDAIDAITGDGPWKLITGETVFVNHGQLATQPSVPINVTEMGTVLPDTEAAWTGTATGGRANNLTCDNWASASGAAYGLTGNVNRTDLWTEAGAPSCAYKQHVYCFEQ